MHLPLPRSVPYRRYFQIWKRLCDEPAGSGDVGSAVDGHCYSGAPCAQREWIPGRSYGEAYGGTGKTAF